MRDGTHVLTPAGAGLRERTADCACRASLRIIARPLGADIGGLAEWSKAAVLKTVEPRGSRGSNPWPTAKNEEQGAPWVPCFCLWV